MKDASTLKTPLLLSQKCRISIVTLLLATLTSSLAFAGTKASTSQASVPSEDDTQGRVLPPHAAPNGYSLSAIAKATAFFNTGLPRTIPPDLPCLLEEAEDCAPLQILFSVNGDNAFSVSQGTIFYVPVLYNDDSPAIIASDCPPTATVCADFPNVGNRQALLNYIYSPKEIGLVYSRITVDGRVHDLGSDYLVEVKVPELADGVGTQYQTSAAFVAPLSPGIHTVVISSFANGDDTIEYFGKAFGPNTTTYTVTVH